MNSISSFPVVCNGVGNVSVNFGTDMQAANDYAESQSRKHPTTYFRIFGLGRVLHLWMDGMRDAKIEADTVAFVKMLELAYNEGAAYFKSGGANPDHACPYGYSDRSRCEAFRLGYDNEEAASVDMTPDYEDNFAGT